MHKKSQSIVHPGRILRETVLPEAGLSVSDAARALGESDQVLQNILAEDLSLSAALCLKIAKLFNNPPELWIRLQASYDLQSASRDEGLKESLTRIIPIVPRPSALL